MRDAAQNTGKSGSSNIRSLFMVMIFVFVAAALISIAGTADDSDEGTTFTVDGINYETISESEVRIISNSYSGIAVIPSSVENGGMTYSVTSIGDYAFSECTSLTEITASSGNAYYCSDNGVLFDKTKTMLIQYPAGRTDTSRCTSSMRMAEGTFHNFSFC